MRLKSDGLNENKEAKRKHFPLTLAKLLKIHYNDRRELWGINGSTKKSQKEYVFLLHIVYNKAFIAFYELDITQFIDSL